jgi:hypothetical protein
MSAIGLLALLCLASYTDVSPQRDIHQIVHCLGINDSSTIYQDLEFLTNRLDSSVALLVSELDTIQNLTKVSPEEVKRYSKAHHIVWCVRALRYLTGIDFTGRTKYVFQSGEGVRKKLLQVDKGEYSFFAVRMAHDTIYIAPIDVQIAVIRQWKAWLVGRSLEINFKKRNFNDWYY